MKPLKKTIWWCSECSEEFEEENDADYHTREQHVPPYFDELRWQCSECLEVYDDKDSARECCKK